MSGFKAVKKDQDAFVDLLHMCRMSIGGLFPITGYSSILAITIVLSLFCANGSHAAVTVTFPNAQLQGEFIASTTGQWIATVKPGLFSGDYKVSITAKNEMPPVPLPTTGSAMDALLAVMIGQGMGYEREANIDQIYGLQGEEALSRKCGGFPIDQIKSTTTLLGACMQTYNNAANAINQRWGQIFDSKGVLVEP